MHLKNDNRWSLTLPTATPTGEAAIDGASFESISSFFFWWGEGGGDSGVQDGTQPGKSVINGVVTCYKSRNPT